MTEYRYGVRKVSTHEVWRDHFRNAKEAIEWVQEWEDDGGKPGIFEPVETVVEWKPVDGWN